MFQIARVLSLIETATPSTNAEALAQQVSQEAEANIQTGDDVNQLAQSLYKWTLQAPERARNAALACNALRNIEKDSIKFRSPFLLTLNKDYDSRNEWKDSDETKWVSLGCLLCQVYKEFKVGEAGSRFAALEEPALNCIEEVSCVNEHKGAFRVPAISLSDIEQS